MTETFDEGDHPRDTGGKFTDKHNSAPAVSLPQPLTDPWGNMPAFPVEDSDKAVFADARTFAEIDAAYAAHRPAGGAMDEITYRWAAIERGRQLRREGSDPGVPTSLPVEGFDANPFAHAQNQTELEDLWALSTEEPPGDGEASTSFVSAWHRRLSDQYRARHAELNAARRPQPEPLVWAVEGDDHEVRLVEASTVDEAIQVAAERFSGDYGEDYDPDLLTVAGAFRGDIDDEDSLEFVAIESIDNEQFARRALRNAD